MGIPVFPTLVGIQYPIARVARLDTTRVKAFSGRMTSLPRWPFPLYDFEISCDYLGANVRYEWQALSGFWNRVMYGPGQYFQFNFLEDSMVSSATTFGTGDATTTTFQLVRTLGQFTENVYAPRINYVAPSDMTFGTTWTLAAITIPSINNTAPDGTTTAFKLGETATTAVHGITQNPASLLAYETYTTSVYVKAVERTWCYLQFTGKDAVVHQAFFNLSTGVKGTVSSAIYNTTITLIGSSWYRISFTFPLGTGATTAVWGLYASTADGTTSYAGTGGSGILAWQPQLEAGSGLQSPLGSPTGAPLGPLVYKADWQGTVLQYRSARTNNLLRSNDFSNSAWTKSSATGAKDQTGPEGTATSASSLLATAGNATCLQAVTLASAPYTYSVWLKRLVGTGNIDLTLDNGSTWTTVVITASWAVYSITQTLANPTAGIRVVTNTDKIAASYNMVVAGSTVTAAITTTTGATATTDYSINDAGLVTFATAPVASATLTWTGYFNWLCQFTEDTADFANFAYLFWNLGRIPFSSALP